MYPRSVRSTPISLRVRFGSRRLSASLTIAWGVVAGSLGQIGVDQRPLLFAQAQRQLGHRLAVVAGSLEQ